MTVCHIYASFIKHLEIEAQTSVSIIKFKSISVHIFLYVWTNFKEKMIIVDIQKKPISRLYMAPSVLQMSIPYR